MTCKPRSGSAVRNKKVSIESLTGTTADAHGHVDNTAAANWTEYVAAFCSVQSKGGREFWKVDQVNANVDHVWETGYNATIAAVTPDMRLKHDGNTYEIIAIIDIDLSHETIQIQTRRAV